MTTDPYYPPPPYTPSDPLTPSTTQAPNTPLRVRGGHAQTPPYSPSAHDVPSHTTPLRSEHDLDPPHEGEEYGQRPSEPHHGDGTLSPSNFSSAAPYFEGRQPRTHAHGQLAKHILFIGPATTTGDVAHIPCCWRGRTEDLTQADMSTFGNFLLPYNASQFPPRKLRTEIVRSEKDSLSPTDNESETERKERVSVVVAEWNQEFFYPRGLEIELDFIADGQDHSWIRTCPSCHLGDESADAPPSESRSQRSKPSAARHRNFSPPLPSNRPAAHGVSIPSQPSQPAAPYGLGPLGYLRAAVGQHIQAHAQARSSCPRSRGRGDFQRGFGPRFGAGFGPGFGRGFGPRFGPESSPALGPGLDPGYGPAFGRGLFGPRFDSEHPYGQRPYGNNHHHHNHRRGSTNSISSTSSSSSSSSESSVDSVSSNDVRGLTLNAVQTSIANVKLKKQEQKLRAKTAVRELKRDLRGKKHDISRMPADSRLSVGKDEKREIKQALKGVKREFNGMIREAKKGKKTLKRERRERKREMKRAGGRGRDEEGRAGLGGHEDWDGPSIDQELPIRCGSSGKFDRA